MIPTSHCTTNEARKIIKFNREKIRPVSSASNNLPIIGKEIIVIVERNITRAHKGAVVGPPQKVSTAKVTVKRIPE